MKTVLLALVFLACGYAAAILLPPSKIPLLEEAQTQADTWNLVAVLISEEPTEAVEQAVALVDTCQDLPNREDLIDVDTLPSDSVTLPVFHSSMKQAIDAMSIVQSIQENPEMAARGVEPVVIEYCAVGGAKAKAVLLGDIHYSEGEDFCRDLGPLLEDFSNMASCSNRLVRFPSCAMKDADASCVYEASEPQSAT